MTSSEGHKGRPAYPEVQSPLGGLILCPKPQCEFTLAGRPTGFSIQPKHNRHHGLKGPYLVANHYIGRNPNTGNKRYRSHSFGRVSPDGAVEIKWDSPNSKDVIAKVSRRLAAKKRGAASGSRVSPRMRREKYGSVILNKIRIGKSAVVYLWPCPSDGKEVVAVNLAKEAYLIRRHLDSLEHSIGGVNFKGSREPLNGRRN